MNANASSTRRGFEIYCDSVPRPSLDEINEVLESTGNDRVSKRTYDHYSRLVRHGYNSYLPVNELDMRVKLERMGELGRSA